MLKNIFGWMKSPDKYLGASVDLLLLRTKMLQSKPNHPSTTNPMLA